MSVHDTGLAETKPETEWVRGRPLRNVSSTYSHARLQTSIGGDPPAARFDVRDLSGRRSYAAGNLFGHRALPGLAVDVGALFVRARR